MTQSHSQVFQQCSETKCERDSQLKNLLCGDDANIDKSLRQILPDFGTCLTSTPLSVHLEFKSCSLSVGNGKKGSL